MRTLRSSLAVTVILGLLGGLSGAVVAQDGEEAGGSEAVATWVQGTSRIVNNTDFGDGTMLDEDGFPQQLRGRTYEGVIEANDPRVAGTTTGTLNWQIYPVTPDVSAWNVWGTERIENEGGAWECTWSGGDMALGLDQSLAWCVGVGGYEGYAMQTISTARQNDPGRDWVGLVWPGDLPPLPETPHAE